MLEASHGKVNLTGYGNKVSKPLVEVHKLEVKDTSHAQRLSAADKLINAARNSSKDFFNTDSLRSKLEVSRDEAMQIFGDADFNPLRDFVKSVPHGVPVVVELCAGSAGLSAALRVYHVQSVAIDHTLNRHRAKVAVVNIDLASENGQRLVCQLLDTGLVLHVHGAPPCGTASRARDKPVPKWLVAQGAPNPRPLRSTAWPEGVPDLSGTGLRRVEIANAIYKFMASLPVLYPAITFSFENPMRSYLWEIKQWKDLAALPNWQRVVYQNCMYGSRKDKWSTWLTNLDALSGLKRLCDGKHNHEPYRILKADSKWTFDTSGEAEYSPELCKEAANLIVEGLRKRGCTIPDPSFDESSGLPAVKRRRIAASNGLFPRGRTLPSIIPEFREVVTLQVPPGVQVKEGKFKKSLFPGCPFSGVVLKLNKVKGEGRPTQQAVIGINFTPVEFVQRAAELRHPIDSTLNIHDSVMKNIFETLHKGPEYIMSSRCRVLKEWLVKALELKVEEDKLHRSMPEEFRVIFAKKRFLLWEHICKDANYVDCSVVREAVRGFDIIGTAPISLAFPTQLIPATISREQLLEHAPLAQASLPATARSSGDPDMDKELWD